MIQPKGKERENVKLSKRIPLTWCFMGCRPDLRVLESEKEDSVWCCTFRPQPWRHKCNYDIPFIDLMLKYLPSYANILC